jgi:hypothetical protein
MRGGFWSTSGGGRQSNAMTVCGAFAYSRRVVTVGGARAWSSCSVGELPLARPGCGSTGVLIRPHHFVVVAGAVPGLGAGAVVQPDHWPSTTRRVHMNWLFLDLRTMGWPFINRLGVGKQRGWTGGFYRTLAGFSFLFVALPLWKRINDDARQIARTVNPSTSGRCDWRPHLPSLP